MSMDREAVEHTVTLGGVEPKLKTLKVFETFRVFSYHSIAT
jgi:hypothetical protein